MPFVRELRQLNLGIEQTPAIPDVVHVFRGQPHSQAMDRSYNSSEARICSPEFPAGAQSGRFYRELSESLARLVDKRESDSNGARSRSARSYIYDEKSGKSYESLGNSETASSRENRKVYESSCSKHDGPNYSIPVPACFRRGAMERFYIGKELDAPSCPNRKLTHITPRPMEEELEYNSYHSEDECCWVTVFGFGAQDTKSVMRVVKSCGPVSTIFFGPFGANWMHVRYESKYDAKKALLKNGVQIEEGIIIGVKKLKESERKAMIERLQEQPRCNQALPSLDFHRSHKIGYPEKGVHTYLSPSKSIRTFTPHLVLQPGNKFGCTSNSDISKMVDLVFGM